MRLSFQRPTALRAVLGVLVFTASLVIIWANYRPPLYGDRAAIAVLSKGDRTSEGMAAHERRLGSAETLRRASLDPRLAGLDQPLRASDGTEAIGSVPGPSVYVSVRSMEDGVLSIDSVSENSGEEAKLIALAVADAYAAELGEDRISLVSDPISTASEIHPSALSGPWDVITVLLLGGLASGFVLFAPTVWFSKRRWATTLVLALAVTIYLLQQFPPTMSVGFLGPIDLVAAAVLLAALGLGAMRRPWIFLATAILLWIIAPVISHGFNTPSLVGQFSLVAWVLGGVGGWASRLSVQGKETEKDMETEPRGKS